MDSRDCTRFPTCSANICPLDDQWPERKHLDTDRVCHLLVKAAKNENPKESEAVWEKVINEAPAIWKTHTRIRNKCTKKQ